MIHWIYDWTQNNIVCVCVCVCVIKKSHNLSKFHQRRFRRFFFWKLKFLTDVRDMNNRYRARGRSIWQWLETKFWKMLKILKNKKKFEYVRRTIRTRWVSTSRTSPPLPSSYPHSFFNFQFFFNISSKFGLF